MTSVASYETKKIKEANMPRKRKVVPLGTVWSARATLLNSRGKKVAYCVDTPNAIAKALMRVPRAARVKSILGTHIRDFYKTRMKPWNKARSGLVRVK